jgi:hypothetical protein
MRVYWLLPKMHNQLQAVAASLAGAAGLLLGAGSASAVTIPTESVLVNGTTYDVTYFVGSYNDNTSRFTTAEMPWWGDASLAKTFAETVGTKLGSPNGFGGPAFAYGTAVGGVVRFLTTYVYSNSSSSALYQTPVDSQSWPYATATPQTTAPVPAPLPIFGAAAAFSATKRLRIMSRRLHRSTTSGS